MSSRVSGLAAKRVVFSMPPMASSVIKTPIWISVMRRSTESQLSLGHNMIFRDVKKFSSLAL